MFRLGVLGPGRYERAVERASFEGLRRKLRMKSGEVLLGRVLLSLAGVGEKIVLSGEAAGAVRRAPGGPGLEQRNRQILGAQLPRIRQGLVGGVEPLPVEIPVRGKVLVLSGVLPPWVISITLRVKGRDERVPGEGCRPVALRRPSTL